MSEPKPDLSWQRTSPIAVVFFLFKSARALITNGLPAVAVIAAAYASGGVARKSWMLAGFLFFLVAATLASILAWLRFRFCVVNETVLVRSGILLREELTVEFGRIQNISIREPVYMRPFGLTVLSIDTAGSGKKEIDLGGIKKDRAIQLRETILSKSRVDSNDITANSVDQSQAQTQESILLSRSPQDIVIYGLTANFILWILVAVGAFFGAHDVTENFLIWLTNRVEFHALLAAFESLGNLFASLLILIGLMVLLFIILPLISVLGALFRHYDYRLSVEAETYRKNSGLLTRHDESMKRHKVQAMVINQNFMARFFKRFNLQLRIASAGSGAESGQLPSGTKRTFLVPVLHHHELIELTHEFFPDCDIKSVQFSRINRRRFTRVILGWVMLPLILITGILSLMVTWKFLLMPLIVLTLAWVIISQFWKKTGYGVVGDYGFVRRGFLGHQNHCLSPV